MKRTFLYAALASMVLAWGAGQAQAQTAGTRVAVVNIGAVFQKYDKAKFYKAEMDKMLEPYRLEVEKLRKEMVDWQNAMNHPQFKKEDRPRYESGILANKRKIEDIDREVRNRVGKKQEEQIVGLYRDVSEAVKGYAQANGLQLVLAYGDPAEGDHYTFPNVNRKMQGMDLGTTNPFFFVPQVDISQAIIDTLNHRYRAGAAGTVPATPVSLPKQ